MSEFLPFTPKNPDEEKVVRHLLQRDSRYIREIEIYTLLKGIFERMEMGFSWIESNINLWELVRRHYDDPKEILIEYLHPLQPNIDLLCVYGEKGEKATPLHGVEVKLFSQVKGKVYFHGEEIGPSIPKAKAEESGFYSGIGETLMLYHFGMDYASLCQIALLPIGIWEGEEDKVDKLIFSHAEFWKAYREIIIGTMDHLDLPIGFLQIAILQDKERNIISYLVESESRAPKLQTLVPTGAKIRKLLLKKFGIKEKIYTPEYLDFLSDK